MTSREIIRRLRSDLTAAIERLHRTSLITKREYHLGRIAGLRRSLKLLETRQARIDGAYSGAKHGE